MIEQTQPWISLIAAVADNGVIGKDNKLPWYLPEDLRHFKQLTQYKPVIMGRKTYESLGKPLPNRLNIVVSRNHPTSIEQATNIQRVDSLERAIQAGTAFYNNNYPYHSEHPDAAHFWEIMIIGGAKLYEAALPRVQRMYITQVHQSTPGDCYFPDWQQGSFKQSNQDGPHRSHQGLEYTFMEWARLKD